MARPYEKREMRLVAEWAVATFPGQEIRFRQFLGRIQTALPTEELTPAELRALGGHRRYPDAIVIEATRMHLVEGKLRGEPGALEQLDLYARLLPITPELNAYRNYPITRHLVWAIPDPVIESLARERGIEVHLYRPAWVDEYFGTLRARQAAPTKDGGLLDLELEST